MCESSLRVIHNNVILLQPAVYPYLHRLIYQQSPHHLLLKLLVCYCVCNLSANVIPCSVVMLCIAIANLKFNDALILFNCVYIIHVDVAAHLPPMVKYVTTSSNEEADNSSNSRKQN